MNEGREENVIEIRQSFSFPIVTRTYSIIDTSLFRLSTDVTSTSLLY